MAEERDERWVYVVLGLVAVGYLAYSNWDAVITRVNLRHLGRFTSSIGYLVAPLVAVIMGLVRRRKSEAVRKQWDVIALAEGVIREERGVRTKAGDSKGGWFKADVRLTRTALYVLDTTGRKDPMRLMVHLESVNDLGLFDAEYALSDQGGGGIVTVRVVGRTKFGIQFSSPQSLAWWTDIRRALGLRAGARPETPGERPEKRDERPTGHDARRMGQGGEPRIPGAEG